MTAVKVNWSVLIPVVLGFLTLVGVVFTAYMARRSSKETSEIESRRVEAEVRNADVGVLRETMTQMQVLIDLERARGDRTDRRVDALKTEVRYYRAEAQQREAHIEVLEQWIWAQKPPPPPPRPRFTAPDSINTAASPPE